MPTLMVTVQPLKIAQHGHSAVFLGEASVLFSVGEALQLEHGLVVL